MAGEQGRNGSAGRAPTVSTARQPGPEVTAAAPARTEAATPVVGPQGVEAVAAGVELLPPAALSTACVLAVQRSAGNRAVGHLLGRPRSPALDPGVPPVQRDGPTSTATEQTPEDPVDQATTPGFSEWAEEVAIDAQAAIAEADQLAADLQSPYGQRLEMLIHDLHRRLDVLHEGIDALYEGEDAPQLTADPMGFKERFEEQVIGLEEVVEAWGTITRSELMTLLAAMAELQVERARTLRWTLNDIKYELEQLDKLMKSGKLKQAYVQLGINVAITGALLAITVATPFGMVAATLASLAGGVILDEVLGPGGNDLNDAAAGTASVAGTGMEAATEASQKLSRYGRRLGVVGTVAGLGLDVKEIGEGHTEIARVQERMRELGQRLESVSGDLAMLRPFLDYPERVRRQAFLLRNEAETLRRQGQLVLRSSNQM